MSIMGDLRGRVVIYANVLIWNESVFDYYEVVVLLRSEAELAALREQASSLMIVTSKVRRL